MLGSVVLFYLAGVNLAAFAAFGIDKRKAVRHRWRIPEATLLGLCLLEARWAASRGCACSTTRPARRGFSWGCR